MESAYTDEQKSAILTRADEIGIADAAKEYGIDGKIVMRWSSDHAGGDLREDSEGMRCRLHQT